MICVLLSLSFTFALIFMLSFGLDVWYLTCYYAKVMSIINANGPTWWRHQMETFPRYWPFVRGIHRSPMNSPHKGQWRGALIFSLICAWINGQENNRETDDLRHHRAHYDVIVMRRSVLITDISKYDNAINNFLYNGCDKGMWQMIWKAFLIQPSI